MGVRTLCGNTTARGSGNESFLQEVGLVDITDGVGFLPDRRSKGLDSARTAVELVDYRGENRAVHLVKATRIDLKQLRRAQGHFAGHHRQLIDLGKIAHAPQQPVGDPRRPARARGEFDRTLAVDSNRKQMG